jgi:carbon starvation protein
MPKLAKFFVWVTLAVLGAWSLSAIAFERGEPVNGVWFITASGCVYLLAHRFYAAFLAARVLALDDTRATPAERLEDGRDFVPTNRWVLLGHHFAAIAGPGPLVGPTLAAQFGYLPGTLWLIFGSVLGGCVQDFVILFCSMRRDGRSIGQMARDEVNPRAGRIALFAVLAIMVILLAAVGLVLVNALKESPWGASTLILTIPIAMLVGCYMRFWRPGRVLEASLIGFLLILFAVVAGRWIAESPSWAAAFTFTGGTLAIGVCIYGFLASALPVWLLLAPRDYLSAFIKVGVVLALALGILLVRPVVHMPALTQFTDGNGPVFAGKIFPFCFITIACGAISGFHALVASGTTPRLIRREGDAPLIGYGSMLMESFVGVMAMVAACALEPGIYFAINSPAGVIGTDAATAAAKITSWGFPLRAEEMQQLAQDVGEQSLLSRVGGAPSLAVGMAQIFNQSIGGGRMLGIWYHFAIMFEAMFILTVLDAGTRVGRFMVQEVLGLAWKPLARPGWLPAVLLSSALIVGAWGYLLYVGVNDPQGGIKSLWPLFGIANQLLATVALVVATTILIKMKKARWAWVTLVPMVWLIVITMSAAWEKIFSPEVRIGFLADAEAKQKLLDAGGLSEAAASSARSAIWNDWLDAGLAGLFAVLVLVLLLEAIGEWWRILSGRKQAVLNEAPYVASRWTETRR